MLAQRFSAREFVNDPTIMVLFSETIASQSEFVSALKILCRRSGFRKLTAENRDHVFRKAYQHELMRRLRFDCPALFWHLCYTSKLNRVQQWL